MELSQTAVSNHLKTTWLGQTYHHFASIGSTNSYLKQQPHLPHGTVIVTDFQEAGRGRFDRVWQAPPRSSLLISILLRPTWPTEQLVWLGMLAGLAGIEAIDDVAQVAVALKWPNDLVVQYDNQWHKLSGLLVEMNWLAGRQTPDAIIGMGLNVNIEAEDLPTAATPATSLKVATGQPVSRLALLCRFLERLEAWYERVAKGESPQPLWEKQLITIGEQVQVTAVRDGRGFSGLAESTNQWGQLLVRDETGKLHTVSAGDVTLRKR